jgi:aerobic carbon-monoxide dehydrogenase small subunit
MKAVVRCEINGQEHEVLADGRDTLLEMLRRGVGLTGTKEGCSNGNCGSCTVLLDDAPVNACLVLAMEANGARIETIEGVQRGGTLHRLQRAFIDHGATQCGFCTPGLVLSAKALLERTPNPTEPEVRHAIAGNLCRCTGYDKVVEAILSVASEPEVRS